MGSLPEPRTVVEAAMALFEHLHERGQLRIANVGEIAVAREPVFRYQNR
jgi:hypothetical protein